jgi:hypothetical protein
LRSIRFGVTGLLVAGLSAPAWANWEYTRWGMSPEQVAAASSGAVKVLPKAQRQSGGGDHSEIAAMGIFESEGLTLSVGFQFDTVTGGLTCVLYNAMGDDVAELKDLLVKKYGQATQSEFPGGYSMTWKTPESIELAVGERPLAAAVTHCKAGM